MRATASRAIWIRPFVDIGQTDLNIVCDLDNACNPLGIGFGLVLLYVAADGPPWGVTTPLLTVTAV